MWPIVRTSSATSARMRSAIGLPLMSVADMGTTLESPHALAPEERC
jgi:hypothetical protein